MSNRDTQFQGFAKALLDEILEAEIGRVKSTYWRGAVESIIARRAYDLAIEVAKQAIDGNSYDEERDARHILEKLGDLTELPKEQDDSVSIYESLCNDEGVMQVAIQITKALEPPRNYDNFGRIIAFSEGPEPPKEQEP